MLLDAADPSRFSSVLLQPLGHLPLLKSTTYERFETDYRTLDPFQHHSSIFFAFNRLTRGCREPNRKLCKTTQCPTRTYGDFVELRARPCGVSPLDAILACVVEQLARAYVWDYAGEMKLMRRFWDAAVLLDPAARDLDACAGDLLLRPEGGWGASLGKRLMGLRMTARTDVRW